MTFFFFFPLYFRFKGKHFLYCDNFYLVGVYRVSGSDLLEKKIYWGIWSPVPLSAQFTQKAAETTISSLAGPSRESCKHLASQIFTTSVHLQTSRCDTFITSDFQFLVPIIYLTLKMRVRCFWDLSTRLWKMNRIVIRSSETVGNNSKVTMTSQLGSLEVI